MDFIINSNLLDDELFQPTLTKLIVQGVSRSYQNTFRPKYLWFEKKIHKCYGNFMLLILKELWQIFKNVEKKWLLASWKKKNLNCFIFCPLQPSEGDMLHFRYSSGEDAARWHPPPPLVKFYDFGCIIPPSPG